jgi:hypothetical protein
MRRLLLVPFALLVLSACAQASDQSFTSPTPTPTPPTVSAADRLITTTDGGQLYAVCDSLTGNLIYLSAWEGSISVLRSLCPQDSSLDIPLTTEREINTPDAGTFVIKCDSNGVLIYLSRWHGLIATLPDGCPKS